MAGVSVGGFALLMFFVIKQIPGTWNLRISREGELEGLDIHEHGTPAYHMEFGYGMSYTTPAGLGGQSAPVISPLRETEPTTSS